MLDDNKTHEDYRSSSSSRMGRHRGLPYELGMQIMMEKIVQKRRRGNVFYSINSYNIFEFHNGYIYWKSKLYNLIIHFLPSWQL